jgi:rhamnose utilization protein RhaD (predicted bifunctional aldolase and dehydrogenase)
MARKVTLIKQAWEEYAQAYTEYHRVCKDMRIRVETPRIYYMPGKGYEINGKITAATADEIISNLKAHTADCIGQMQAECADLALKPDEAIPMTERKPDVWYSITHPTPEPLSGDESEN